MGQDLALLNQGTLGGIMYVTQKGMDRLNAEKADLAKKWCQHIARNKRGAAHSGSEIGSSVPIDGLEPYGCELKRRIADNKALLETSRLAPVPTQTMMLAIGQIATIRIHQWRATTASS